MESKNTMDIWLHACETPASATKKSNQGGFNQTSIDGYWMMQKATEIWGPFGTGWGIHIDKDEFRDGLPIINSEGVIVGHTQMHTLAIRLWYDGEKDMQGVPSFGHTPYIMNTKNGPKCDMEAPKKSMTDAIKKALSFLGFGADIYQGMHDDPSYVEAMTIKENIQNAEEKDKEIEKSREELKSYIEKHLDCVERGKTEFEVNSIVKLCLKHLNRQINIPEISDIAQKGIDAISKKGMNVKSDLKSKGENKIE